MGGPVSGQSGNGNKMPSWSLPQVGADELGVGFPTMM